MLIIFFCMFTFTYLKLSTIHEEEMVNLKTSSDLSKGNFDGLWELMDQTFWLWS